MDPKMLVVIVVVIVAIIVIVAAVVTQRKKANPPTPSRIRQTRAPLEPLAWLAGQPDIASSFYFAVSLKRGLDTI